MCAYAAELICSTGVLGFHTFKLALCIHVYNTEAAFTRWNFKLVSLWRPFSRIQPSEVQSSGLNVSNGGSWIYLLEVCSIQLESTPQMNGPCSLWTWLVKRPLSGRSKCSSWVVGTCPRAARLGNDGKKIEILQLKVQISLHYPSRSVILRWPHRIIVYWFARASVMIWTAFSHLFLHPFLQAYYTLSCKLITCNSV